jgi:carboxypeptidase Q
LNLDNIDKPVMNSNYLKSDRNKTIPSQTKPFKKETKQFSAHSLKLKALSFLILSLLSAASFAQDKESEMVRKIYDEALTNNKSYEMLEYLCKKIGHRLSGSPQAAAAVEWSRQQMISLEFDTVYLQPVIVPRWERGSKETGRILGAKQGDFETHILSLGNSIGTGEKGLRAEIVEVKGIDELNKLGKKVVENKIVFFNRPLNPTFISTGDAYVDAVDQRVHGASAAAKLGAQGVIVRSMTLAIDHFPHTGVVYYKPESPKIPAVAISTKDAELLSNLLKQDNKIQFYLENYCQMKDSVLSYNVIGELRGTQKPNEILTIGGHLDSWDIGEGAHDDGTGCVQSMEALRIFKTLGVKPKRTIRAVMFMNEENGGRGGKAYAKSAIDKKEIHKVAIESDEGGFTPLGFSVDASKEQFQKISSIKKYFEPYNVYTFREGFSGADIEPLKPQGTAVIGYVPHDHRYFNIHHTANDTFDKVDKRELALGSASMASLIYLLDQKDDL